MMHLEISAFASFLRPSGKIALGLGLALSMGCGSATPDEKTGADASSKKDGEKGSTGSKSGKSGGSGGKAGSSGGEEEKDPGSEDSGNPGPEGGPKFDIEVPEPTPKDPNEIPDCEEVSHRPCDKTSDDPLNAMGINCPGEEPRIKGTFMGTEESRGIRTSLGNTDAFKPREGVKYLVLGTGKVAELDKETPEGDRDYGPKYCSDILGKLGVPGNTLPAPIKTNRVGTQDCEQNPSLVGKGDCSNTIQAQWDAAGSAKPKANDYAELRLKMKVPLWAKSLSYDFAFATVEYPAYYGKRFNDLFIAWLESKRWTGNVSFDDKGNPISLNAGFLDYRDAEKGTINDPDCAQGCKAPELHGSCLKQHAATKWLRTSFGVTPGEEIELIFAIMDLHDPILDSYVLLDNFRWGCDDKGKPKTDPPI